MDIDIYKKDLNERLGNAGFGALPEKDFQSIIRKRDTSVFKKIKIVFRLEILICLAEIISSVLNLFQAADTWSIIYYLVQLVISIVFIFIFLRLISIINSPSIKAMPVKESTDTVLSLLQKFYSRYLLFVLLYVLLNGIINIIALTTENTGFEADKALAALLTRIENPVYRYIYLFVHQVVLGLLVYLICRWLIRLLYGRRIKELKKLSEELNS